MPQGVSGAQNLNLKVSKLTYKCALRELEPRGFRVLLGKQVLEQKSPRGFKVLLGKQAFKVATGSRKAKSVLESLFDSLLTQMGSEVPCTYLLIREYAI